MPKIKVGDTLVLLLDVSFYDEKTTWDEVYASVIAGIYKNCAPALIPYDVKNVRLFVEE